MSKLRENKPTADVLMVSMRAMGYSFESAVADVIDNSISAHASSKTVDQYPQYGKPDTMFFIKLHHWVVLL